MDVSWTNEGEHPKFVMSAHPDVTNVKIAAKAIPARIQRHLSRYFAGSGRVCRSPVDAAAKQTADLLSLSTTTPCRRGERAAAAEKRAASHHTRQRSCFRHPPPSKKYTTLRGALKKTRRRHTVLWTWMNWKCFSLVDSSLIHINHFLVRPFEVLLHHRAKTTTAPTIHGQILENKQVRNGRNLHYYLADIKHPFSEEYIL